MLVLKLLFLVITFHLALFTKQKKVNERKIKLGSQVSLKEGKKEMNRTCIREFHLNKYLKGEKIKNIRFPSELKGNGRK